MVGAKVASLAGGSVVSLKLFLTVNIILIPQTKHTENGGRQEPGRGAVGRDVCRDCVLP